MDDELIEFFDARIAQFKGLDALSDAVMKVTTPSDLGDKCRILIERIKDASEVVNPGPGRDDYFVEVLHGPAAGLEYAVDLAAGFLLGGGSAHGQTGSPQAQISEVGDVSGQDSVGDELTPDGPD